MIRAFKQSDIDRVMQLWLSGNEDAHPFISREYWRSHFAEVREQIVQADVFVRETDGTIRGFIGIVDGYIAGIFVDKTCRSCGIGTELLTYAKQNHETLSLGVYQQNRRAVAFYFREGFSVQAEAVDEDTGEAEYTMVWGRKQKLEHGEDGIKITEITKRTPKLQTQLLDIWEQSVKATHLFLSDDEINRIKEYVPQALRSVANLVIAEHEDGSPIAFMGVEDGTLEMLFLAPDERGKGLGRTLILHGIRNYSIRKVTVNEQNPLAKGFYEHMGFRVYRRTDEDEQGNPYPLLYMELADDWEKRHGSVKKD